MWGVLSYTVRGGLAKKLRSFIEYLLLKRRLTFSGFRASLLSPVWLRPGQR